MNKNQKLAKNMLKSRNINSSYYRIIILENMIKRESCMKASDLYELIHRNSPTISRATLYNNLLIFENSGLVEKISFGQEDVRYCINNGKSYIYFKCKKCSKVYKIENELTYFEGDMIDGHKIEKLHVIACGVCKKCLK